MIEKLNEIFPLTLRVHGVPELERVYGGAEEVVEEIETERKYLVPNLDVEGLRDKVFRTAEIQQRYIYANTVDPESGKDKEVRFRLRHWQVTQDGKPLGEPIRFIQFKQSIGGKKSHTKRERKEVLPQDNFEKLWERATWQPIHKTREYISHVGLSGRKYEIHIDTYHDVYQGDTLEGFQTVEFEFHTKEDEDFFHKQREVLAEGGHKLFKEKYPDREPDVPEWLWSAQDVTDDVRYKNWMMSQKRRPKV